MNGRVDLWGHNIAVDWAEPELEVDEEIMAQVSPIYSLVAGPPPVDGILLHVSSG